MSQNIEVAKHILQLNRSGLVPTIGNAVAAPDDGPPTLTSQHVRLLRRTRRTGNAVGGGNHCSLPHPIDFERPYAVNLYNGVFVYGKMVHAFGHDHVRSCWHVLASCFIILVTDAHTENSREHR